MKSNSFASYNPATGDLLWEGTEDGKREINKAVKEAWKAFPKWRSTSFKERFLCLTRFSELLKERKEAFATLISEENGKPFWEACTEVEAAIAKVLISKMAFETRTGTHLIEDKPSPLSTRFFPHGAIAVLGPFNFPLHLPFGHIAPAILAGNTIVFKPSEHTPATGAALVRLLEEAGLPKGVVNLVHGGRTTGKALASHPDIAGLFFTGSYQAGKSLSTLFGKTPEKILALELGGNNPLVYFGAKNTRAAALNAVQSCFLSTGQRCTAARRLIVVKEGPYETFLNEFRQMASRLVIGAHTERPEPFAGPLISEEAVEKTLATAQALEERGGIPWLPLTRLSKGKCFLSPGIMEVTSVKKRPDEECFGPFVQVILTDSYADAIREANLTAYGLSAALLSDDRSAWQAFQNDVRAGVINWNAPTTGASSKAPFGGIGKSGNHRPSAFFAADYSAYPVASFENPELTLPSSLPPGVSI